MRSLLAEIDQERAREIQRRYASCTAGYAKYANIEPWLRLNRERVQDLKLHRSAPKRVLDLGCGGGFFLFISKKFGHSVLGLDVGHIALFTELLQFFNVPRVLHTITAFEPLPNLGKRSIGSRPSQSILICITRPNAAGERRSGIFSCAICNGFWRRAAKSFLGSIRFITATFTRGSCAIFLSGAAQAWSGRESFSRTGCVSRRRCGCVLLRRC